MTKNQKRLSIFIPGLTDGGAERATLNLIQQLINRNYGVDLVIGHWEKADFEKVPKSVRIVNLEAKRALASIPSLTMYLRREQPEVLFSVLNYANIIAIWARWLARVSTRLVLSEQNTLSMAHKNASRWRSRFIPLLIKLFYPLADEIVAVSKGVAVDLVEMTGLPSDSIQVIYNPVITPELIKKAKVQVDHPWFGEGEPPVILAVGRLRPQKDFPKLIRAFSRVKESFSARLLILGEGSERESLEELIQELELDQDVSLYGYTENPYAYMTQASLFVLSSLWEGLPTVLIEALYCGAPIIATDCLYGPRVILADGEHGSLVPVDDITALADTIKKGLSGGIQVPHENSWAPYAVETVVNQFVHLFWEK